MPQLKQALRSLLLGPTADLDMTTVDGGVYVNSAGPRFETKAEIRVMAEAGSLVGMTAAHEATACQEAGLPYAMLCVVDNFANGIGPDFDLAIFHEEQARNLGRVEAILEALLEQLPRVRLVDRIVHAKYIVPVEPHNEVYQDHALIVHQGKIVSIELSSSVKYKFAATVEQHLEHHVIMPGLINAHTHLAMNHMRGLADDKPLMQWLQEDVWPTEARLVSPEFVKAGVLQAAAESIRSGVTCVNDMYFFPGATVEALTQSGLRASVGATVLEFPTNYASDAAQCIVKGEKLVAGEFGDADGLIKFTWAPHAPYTVSDATFEKLRDLAKSTGTKVHLHLHEAEEEVNSSEAGEGPSKHLSDEKCRPFANLLRLGLANKDLIAVHMVHLTDEEIKQAAQHEVSIVHCPSSNLKLASGFCPVAKLLKAGINVAIGTDSSASNNKLDMLAEMRLAALLAKGVSKDATAANAPTALRMATLNGAKALGVDDVTGSLVPGKDADFIAIRVDNLEVAPVYNVISHLVYVMDRAAVTDVFVRGRQLMSGRHLLTLHEHEIKELSAAWSRKVCSEAFTDPGTPSTPAVHVSQ
jgi:5-methylthioadenosine/S-adenosylhomocysteine deaminase